MKNVLSLLGMLVITITVNAQRTEAPSAADNAGRSTASSSKSLLPTPTSILIDTAKRTIKGGTIGKEQPIRDTKYWERRAIMEKVDRAIRSQRRSTLPKLNKPRTEPVIRGCSRC